MLSTCIYRLIEADPLKKVVVAAMVEGAASASSGASGDQWPAPAVPGAAAAAAAKAAGNNGFGRGGAKKGATNKRRKGDDTLSDGEDEASSNTLEQRLAHQERISAVVLSDIRHIKAGLFRTWVMPVDKQPMSQLIAERKAYDDRVRGKAGKHDFGPPDHALWRGLVVGTVSLVEATYSGRQEEFNQSGSIKTDSDALNKYLGEMRPSSVVYEVKYCRYVKTFKDTTKKLHVVPKGTGEAALNSMARIWASLLKVHEATGVDVKGGLERRNEELAGFNR